MLEILYLDKVDSTHLYLLDAVKQKKIIPPCAVSADVQCGGIGSRGNRWEGLEGNLFLSFCIGRDTLPSDLPVQSMSIYFSYILKEVLVSKGSGLWLKWPNDFYIDEKKAGGTITTITGNHTVVCSVGLNLKKAPEKFAVIDINIDKNELLSEYFLKLKEVIFWKDIFRKYKVEFLQSTKFQYYDETTQQKVSLKQAKLLDDGSIELHNRRIYSLR